MPCLVLTVKQTPASHQTPPSGNSVSGSPFAAPPSTLPLSISASVRLCVCVHSHFHMLVGVAMAWAHLLQVLFAVSYCRCLLQQCCQLCTRSSSRSRHWRHLHGPHPQQDICWQLVKIWATFCCYQPNVLKNWKIFRHRCTKIWSRRKANAKSQAKCRTTTKTQIKPNTAERRSTTCWVLCAKKGTGKNVFGGAPDFKKNKNKNNRKKQWQHEPRL